MNDMSSMGQHARMSQSDRIAPSAAEIEADVKQVFAAVSTMLTGKKGDPSRPGACGNVMMIVGAPLTSSGLMWLGEMAIANDGDILHVSMKMNSEIPNLALAKIDGERLQLFENCMMTVEKPGASMVIVPDNFREGGFKLGRDLKLKRCRAFESFDAALPAMRRAYLRFHKLRATIDGSAVAPIRCSNR